MQLKASAKIGFVEFFAAIQRIGFIEDGHHHRVILLKEISLRLLRAGLGVLVPGLQQVCSAQTF